MNCSSAGLSKPISTLKAATVSGEAKSPARTAAGSLGINLDRIKDIPKIPRIVGKIMIRFLTRNFDIIYLPLNKRSTLNCLLLK